MKSLVDALEGTEYIIEGVATDDEELDAFLFSLGCYKGEKIVLVSRRSGGYVVSIKDGRYTIDQHLAEVIVLSQ
ncbi:MAG: FeoA family protein [Eubacteriales bacterium]